MYGCCVAIITAIDVGDDEDEDEDEGSALFEGMSFVAEYFY